VKSTLVTLALILLVACAAPDPLRRCDAIHEFAGALCERGLRCGTVAEGGLGACVMAQFAAICADNSCDGTVADPAIVDACVAAIDGLDCAATEWPDACVGATR
jgi:hypothetical protein